MRVRIRKPPKPMKLVRDKTGAYSLRETVKKMKISDAIKKTADLRRSLGLTERGKKTLSFLTEKLDKEYKRLEEELKKSVRPAVEHEYAGRRKPEEHTKEEQLLMNICWALGREVPAFVLTNREMVDEIRFMEINPQKFSREQIEKRKEEFAAENRRRILYMKELQAGVRKQKPMF
ncbi:MAG: hypothetical protein QXO69_02930 [archaeon]